MRRRVLGFAVLALVVAAVAGALLTRLAARWVAGELSRASGLEVRFGDLDLSLLPPGVAADDVRVRAPGSGAAALIARRVLVRTSWRLLARRAARIERVRLVGLRLRLVRSPSGRVALAGLPASASDATDAGAPPLLVVGALEIRDGAVRLDDRALVPPDAVGVLAPHGLARGIVIGRDGTLVRAAWEANVRQAAARGTMAGRLRTRAGGVDLRVRARVADVSLPGLAPWLPAGPIRAGTLAGVVEHRWSTAPDAARHRVRGDFRVEGLDGGDDPRVTAAAVQVRGIRADLAARTVTARRVTVRDADATVMRLEAVAGAGVAAGPAPRAWDAVLDDVVVASARLTAPGYPALTVRAARGRTVSTRWPSDAITIDAAVAAGGTLRARGVVDPGAGWVWARAKPRDVALPAVMRLPAPLEVTDGRLTGVATVSTPPLTVTDALVSVDRFGSRTRDAAGPRPALAWHAGRARVLQFTVDPLRLQLSAAELEWPYLVLRRTGRAPGDGAAAGSDPDVRIRALAIRDGTVFVEDRSVTPPYLGSVSGLAVSLRDLDLRRRDVGPLQARGLLNEVAPVTLDVQVDDGGAHDVAASVERLPLPPLDPYLAPAIGWTARRGEADARADVRLTSGWLDARSELVLRGLRVAPAGPDVIGAMTGVPLGVAVALLQDRHGDLRLEVPVTGTPDAPDFAPGTLVVEATARAIVGALASPLTLLGAALTSEGPRERLQIAPIPFPAGSDTPDDEAMRRTDLLAVLLGQRPALRLALHGRSGPADAGAGAPADLLAEARARRVRDLLTERHGVEPARLSVGDPAPAGEPGVLVAPGG